MPTLTIGTHGEVVISKSVRDQLGLHKGTKIDYVFSNNMFTICPSKGARTKMDDDFDRLRDAYLANNITLDHVMASLNQLYETNE